MSEKDIKPTLRSLMDEYELSERDLAVLSEVNRQTIRRILSHDNPYNINFTTAIAIADVFDLGISDIRWPKSITVVGRPANTGTTVVRFSATQPDGRSESVTVVRAPGICLDHFVTLMANGQCPYPHS